MPKKYVISFICLFFLCLGVYQGIQLQDKRLKVIFCDVGQGDAIYIRTPKGFDILFDGGPDTKVLECLARYKPFWERRLGLIILSHPHADHLNGLIDVFERYEVKAFATERLENDSDGYTALIKTIQEENLKVSYVYKGDSIKTKDGVVLNVLSPDKEYLRKTSQDGVIRESGEFASLILHVSYKDFDLLLTGDTQNLQLAKALDQFGLPSLEVLQVPHHGSRTGLTQSLVTRLLPKEAIISVGKNNYGHPTPFTLGLLSNQEVLIHRTDKEGSIEIKTDGESYRTE